MPSEFPPGPDESHRRLIELHVKTDFFGFLSTMNEKYGDFVRIPMDDITVYLVSRPEIVQEVFANDLAHYKKPDFILDFGLRYGDIKLSDEVWRRRSKVVRPAFLQHRVMKSAQTIIECTREMMAGWKPGDLVEINKEMRNLRVRIAARTIFDAELEGFGDPAEAHLRSGVIPYTEAMGEDFVVSPQEGGPPFASMVRRRSIQEDAELIDIIRSCYEAREDRGDILSYLMQATYDDGTPMSFEEVTEELVLLFFSAHYTIPLVMTNLLYQLTQNPVVEESLHNELIQNLEGQAFGPDDLGRLPYGNMVVKETLRMFPPAPILYRELIEDTELHGVPLKVGDYVLVYSHLLHFDARYFEDPHSFIPERFQSERTKEISKHAYLPFGAGPRICMGQALSMLEMRIVLATILEDYRLEAVQGQTVEPKPHFVDGAEQSTWLRVVSREERVSTAPERGISKDLGAPEQELSRA